jgi:hypothetical protein
MSKSILHQQASTSLTHTAGSSRVAHMSPNVFSNETSCSVGV